jgi:hypothetical protein
MFITTVHLGQPTIRNEAYKELILPIQFSCFQSSFLFQSRLRQFSFVPRILPYM